MIDREKTISGLNEIADYFRKCRLNASFGSKAEEHFWDLQIAAMNAAEMLKEQEPKRVIMTTNSYGTKFYHCPRCNHDIYAYPRQMYCSKCGQAVKWDADGA